jgi:hemin uptake protein HemP
MNLSPADPRIPREELPSHSDGNQPGPSILTSQALLQGQTSVVIAHNGAMYRLQTTRQGKLILTK